MITAALLACATMISPVTLDAVVRVESGGDPYAVHVNGLKGKQPTPGNAAEAAATARRYIALGYRVDLGLGQVTNSNLPKLGYTIEQMFDPCTNITAFGTILADNYSAAVKQFGEGQTALQFALSRYNTGTWSAGFSNGYVGKYYISAAMPASVPTAAARPAVPAMPLTVAYDRPGLDLRIN